MNFASTSCISSFELVVVFAFVLVVISVRSQNCILDCTKYTYYIAVVKFVFRFSSQYFVEVIVVFSSRMFLVQ